MRLPALLLVFLALGCSSTSGVVDNGTTSAAVPRFVDLYDALDPADAAPPAPPSDVGPPVTVSADALPLSSFLRVLARDAGVSVVAEASLDGEPVTVDVVEQPAGEVLAAVARRLGVQLTRTGNTYVLGRVLPEDRAVLVHRVPRLRAEAIADAVGVLLSEFGRVYAEPDGLVIVADRVEVIARVRTMLAEVAAAPADSWVVQLHVVALDQSAVADFGLDLTPAAELTARLAVSSEGDDDSLAAASATLTGVLRAAAADENVRTVASPLFLARDGEPARFASGANVPVPIRALVGENATSVVTEFEYRQTGLTATVTPRATAAGRASLAVELELSQIVGDVEGAPVEANRQFSTVAVVSSGGTYLLGSLDRADASDSVAGPLKLAFGRDRSAELVQVWARCYRVAGPSPVAPQDAPDPAAFDPSGLDADLAGIDDGLARLRRQLDAMAD
jgi:hypothetical protein